MLSLGNISHSSVAGNASSWVHDTVSLVPFLALLLLRNRESSLFPPSLERCKVRSAAELAGTAHRCLPCSHAQAAVQVLHSLAARSESCYSCQRRAAASGARGKKSGKGGGLTRTAKKVRVIPAEPGPVFGELFVVTPTPCSADLRVDGPGVWAAHGQEVAAAGTPCRRSGELAGFRDHVSAACQRASSFSFPRGRPGIQPSDLMQGGLQTHFLTMKKAMGRDRAIVLSLFGLVPYVEPWLLRFVQLWRSSNIGTGDHY